MTNTWMAKLPEFAEHFKDYGFNSMMRAPGKYSEVFVHEFYIVYKGEI